MGTVAEPTTGEAKFISFTPNHYKQSNAPAFLKSGFYEEELKRNIWQFGHLATVKSAFQYRFAPGGKVIQRGINYFTLVNAEGRWWINSLVWQDENEKIGPAAMEKE